MVDHHRAAEVDRAAAAVADVVLATSMGNIEITVRGDKAPISAHAFLSLTDNGSLARYGWFYRAVRHNENDNRSDGIDIVQGGLLGAPERLAGIAHEPTARTGITHRHGVVSLARGATGSATGATFFICIGDQPALDAGGTRLPDGLGFAAFGDVTRGMEIVCRIHQLRTTTNASALHMAGQWLDPPVRVLKVFRKTAPI